MASRTAAPTRKRGHARPRRCRAPRRPRARSASRRSGQRNATSTTPAPMPTMAASIRAMLSSRKVRATRHQHAPPTPMSSRPAEPGDVGGARDRDLGDVVVARPRRRRGPAPQPDAQPEERATAAPPLRRAGEPASSTTAAASARPGQRSSRDVGRVDQTGGEPGGDGGQHEGGRDPLPAWPVPRPVVAPSRAHPLRALLGLRPPACAPAGLATGIAGAQGRSARQRHLDCIGAARPRNRADGSLRVRAAPVGLAAGLAALGLEAAPHAGGSSAWSAPRRVHPEGGGQPLAKALEGEVAVAGLGALVGGDHPHLVAQPLEEPGPLARPQRRRTGDVEPHLGAGVGRVGVLPAGTAAPAEPPRQLRRPGSRASATRALDSDLRPSPQRKVAPMPTTTAPRRVDRGLRRPARPGAARRSHRGRAPRPRRGRRPRVGADVGAAGLLADRPGRPVPHRGPGPRPGDLTYSSPSRYAWPRGLSS